MGRRSAQSSGHRDGKKVHPVQCDLGNASYPLMPFMPQGLAKCILCDPVIKIIISVFIT